MDNSLARVVVFDACLGTSVILTSAEVFRFIIIIIIIIYFIFFLFLSKLKEQILQMDRQGTDRAGKLGSEPPIWLTSSGENSETPQRGGDGWGGGGGTVASTPCLYVRELSVFSFKEWLQISLWCVDVRIHWIWISRKSIK